MIDVDKYLNFLEKNDLVPQQFLLLYCIYHKNINAIVKYKKLFPSPDDSMIGSILFEDLLNKNFITKIHNKTGSSATDYHITEKFTKIYADKYVVAEELKEAYPDYFFNNKGQRYPTKYWNEDELRENYWKKINGLVEEHQEVLKDIAYAVKQNLIGAGIESFVLSRHWSTFRKMRLKIIPDKTNTLKRDRL